MYGIKITAVIASLNVNTHKAISLPRRANAQISMFAILTGVFFAAISHTYRTSLQTFPLPTHSQKFGFFVPLRNRMIAQGLSFS